MQGDQNGNLFKTKMKNEIKESKIVIYSGRAIKKEKEKKAQKTTQ